MEERHFTLKEANAQVPWLEETFASLTPLENELTERHISLLELLRHRSSNGSASTNEKIRAQQLAIERINEQLRQSLQEITDRGIMVRDIERGLVDFPSYREGHEVYLCWVRGEKRVGFWHGTDEGFASRKRL